VVDPTIWNDDLELSRKHMNQIIKNLQRLFTPTEIINNEGTELDKQGHDLTLAYENGTTRSVGVRVRRREKKHWDDFTKDHKEITQMECDVYWYGYESKNRKYVSDYLVFDHKDFVRGVELGLIVPITKQNKKHSNVKFDGYPLYQITEYCKVYEIKGKIGWKKPPQKLNGWCK